MTRKLLFLSAMVLMLSSCEGALDDIFGEWSRPTPPAVTSITLNETSLTKMVGDDAFTLTATMNADATDKTLVWTSDKPGVVSVDANGVVTIQGQGLATITVTATNGTESTADDKTATCEVAVFKTVNLAELTGGYQAKDYDMLTGVLDQYSSYIMISIPDGATIKLSGVDIEGNNASYNTWAGLTCLGDATIILAEGTSNKVRGFEEKHPGIYVPSGKTLTIQGSGSLTASSHGKGAGIGGGDGIACGNIIINGGTINATGGGGAAGIGGGNNTTCGNITITSGNITANGSMYAAAIGGGSSGSASCGVITITGGTINANGGDRGAGIGSGGDLSVCGDIIISGGDITAQGINAAGIGTGYNCSYCGNISITGGTISATGGNWAAGIGVGLWGKCGNITIAKTITSVTATKGNNSTPVSNTDPYSIGVGSDNLSNSDIPLCVCGTVTFDTQSFTLTGTQGTGSENNSWTYSPVPVSGTNYGGLTLTISGDTWTLQP